MFEPGLVAYLVAGSTLAGNRIEPPPVPQSPTLPMITYYRVPLGEGGREYSHSGSSNLVHPRYQIDCWASNPDDAWTLGDQVVALLSGAKGAMGTKTAQAAFINNEGDMYEPETGYYRRMIEVEIWHAEAA